MSESNQKATSATSATLQQKTTKEGFMALCTGSWTKKSNDQKTEFKAKQVVRYITRYDPTDEQISTYETTLDENKLFELYVDSRRPYFIIVDKAEFVDYMRQREEKAKDRYNALLSATSGVRFEYETEEYDQRNTPEARGNADGQHPNVPSGKRN